MVQGGGLPKQEKEILSLGSLTVQQHFDYAVCKNCLSKVKYTGNTSNMHSHLVLNYPELAAEERMVSDVDANASVNHLTINTAFNAKLPSGFPRPASITKSIAIIIDEM